MLRQYLTCLSLVAFAVGCSSTDPDVSRRKINVVTTTGMVADLVKHIGGDRVDIKSLMPYDADPHQYEAKAGDTDLMEQADVVFYNGLHLEGKIADVLEKMDKKKTFAVTSCLDPKQDLRPAPEGFTEGTHDPHVWFNVKLWIKAADYVRDVLSELDPKSAEVYRDNATKYGAELEKLHAYVHEQAKRIPESQRRLITAHDAFFYFGAAYGFKVDAVLGVSTVDDANEKDINKLRDRIVEHRVPAIFPESSVSKRYVEQVKRAVEAKKFEVRLGEPLYSDALGHPSGSEGTYVGMMRYNIDAIVRALAPRSGKS